MSSESQIENLKNIYIVYFILCFNFLKISSFEVYFLALYYFILKNSILVTLQYNYKIGYSLSILFI